MQFTVLPHLVARQSPVVGMEVDEFADVKLFRERTEKLATSQRKYQGIPISRHWRDAESGQVAFQANTPDVDEIATLAVRFRLFYADGEPTQFQKILTKVRRRATDQWARGYMDWLAEQYKMAMKASQTSADLGLAVSNRKIIDLWFNSEFFHSEQSKRNDLLDIHATIGQEASLFQLYVAIAHCSSYVRMLYSVIHRLDASHQFIYSPNHHFQRTTSGDTSDV
ncbi:MAG: hypothetical protein HY856_08950 [Burkholderiales bacterium]|nr:hypothetical protein [Burkholderiales bacterium]